MKPVISIKTDFRSVYSALPEYARFRQITIPEALRDRAGKLAWRLYKAYRKFMPSISTIRNIPLYMIRPRKGRSKKRERAVRISARGYTATGWLAAAIKYGKGLTLPVNVPKLAGGYVEHLGGHSPFIEIFNSTPGSVILDAKHNVIEPCVAEDEKDMEVYIQRKLSEATQRFNSH